MNKRIFIFIYLFVSFLFSSEKISLITKKRGVVKVKSSLESLIYFNEDINSSLLDGSHLKTKANSFVKIKYLDGQTTILAFSNTEFSIYGEIKNTINNKKINLINGSLKIDVKNNLNNEFILITPYSKLSCLDCSFWVLSNIEIGDSFYNIRGDAIINNLSKKSNMRLVNDSTLVSYNNEIFEKSLTKVTEKEFLKSLLFNADELIEGDLTIIGNSKNISNNVLEIRLKNAQNIERKIYLTYIK